MQPIRTSSTKHPLRTTSLGPLLLIAACGNASDVTSVMRAEEQNQAIDNDGIVLIDDDGNELEERDVEALVDGKLNKDLYGSFNDIPSNNSTIQIPDGLGAPEPTLSPNGSLNCMWSGSNKRCWFPGFDDKTAVVVCFSPDNRSGFNNVVRDVLSIDSGDYYGGYEFTEGESWWDPECEIVAEEKFDTTSGPYGQGPFIYAGHTVKQTCSSSNLCLSYGVAAFRVWTDRIADDYGGAPYVVTLTNVIHHEIGHVLRLQHNTFQLSDGTRSVMWPSTVDEPRDFFPCETEKLENHQFSNSGSTLTRYSAAANSASCY